MPIAEVFLVTADDLRDPERAAEILNTMLSHISDRLDALQGLRGTSEVQGKARVLDSDGNEIHGFSE